MQTFLQSWVCHFLLRSILWLVGGIDFSKFLKVVELFEFHWWFIVKGHRLKFLSNRWLVMKNVFLQREAFPFLTVLLVYQLKVLRRSKHVAVHNVHVLKMFVHKNVVR
jgi:hypothetical protein